MAVGLADKMIIADRKAICRAGFRALLEAGLKEVKFFEASNFDELRSLARELGDPRLIICDAALPGLPDLKELSQLRAIVPTARLVVTSDLTDREIIQAAFINGAAGFIPKSVTAGVLVGAIDVVLANGIYVPESLAELIAAPARHRDAQSLPPDMPMLTRRQRQVLELLRQGMTNKEIARHLGVATGTVKVHVASVLKALSAGNRTHAAALARRLGISEASPD